MLALHVHLPIPAERGMALIDHNARAHGLNVQRDADRAELHVGFGTIRARPEAAGLRIDIAAEDAEGLERLRLALDRMIEAAGHAAQNWQGAAPDPGRARLTLAEFAGARRISPSYVRVRLAGDFSAFAKGALHFRLLLGPLGAPLPRIGAEGGIDWPGGIDLWHRPPYTVRAIGPGAGWIDVDIFLHHGGRVTEWVSQARPGEVVALTGPGGRGVRQAGWMGLVGDETALPVILRALEAAGPEARGHAMILIPDAADAQQVALPPGLRLDWVPRSAGRSALDLFRALVPPAQDRFLFFAGERREAEAARAHAASLGLAPGEFHAAAYWTEGWVPPPGQRQAGGR